MDLIHKENLNQIHWPKEISFIFLHLYHQAFPNYLLPDFLIFSSLFSYFLGLISFVPFILYGKKLFSSKFYSFQPKPMHLIFFNLKAKIPNDLNEISLFFDNNQSQKNPQSWLGFPINSIRHFPKTHKTLSFAIKCCFLERKIKRRFGHIFLECALNRKGLKNFSKTDSNKLSRVLGTF